MEIIDRIGTYKYRLNNYAGRKLFGNSVRFSDNCKGKYNMLRHRIGPSPTYDSSAIEHARELEDNKFVELGRPYSDDLLFEISEIFNNLIENDDTSKPKAEYNGEIYSRSIVKPQENAPIFLDLLTQEVLDVVGQYYNSNFNLTEISTGHYINAWRNYYVPDDVIEESGMFAERWHCDRHPTDRVKLFVYISEVGTEHGPFHLITQDDTKKMIQDIGYNNEHRNELGMPGQLIEKHADPIRFTGPAGSIALCDTQNCLHRAGVPDEGKSRDLIQFQFKPSSKPISKQISEIKTSQSKS